MALAGAGARVAISGRDVAALERVAGRMRDAAGAGAGDGGGGSAGGGADGYGENDRSGAGGGAGDGGGAEAGVAGERDGAVVLPADLRQPGAAAELVAMAAERLGGLDLVVSNAGAGWAGPLLEITPTEIDALVDLNFRAPLHLIRAALPHLLSSGHGRVVIVGSIAGRLGVAREVVYSATKAGLVGLADALRSELAGTPVTVSLVTPGVVDTAFFDRRNRAYERTRPRPIPVGLVADAVLECARSGRAEITVPRWLEVVARLRGALPGLYRLLANRFG